MELTEKKCTPCTKGTPTLSESQKEVFIGSLTGWELDRSGTHFLRKTVPSENSDTAMEFVNRVADLAREGNHADDGRLLSRIAVERD